MARSTSSGMFRFLPFFLFLLCAATEISVAQDSTGKVKLASKSASPANTVVAKMSGLPLMFERNVGQPGASGNFTARGNGYALDLNSGTMSLRVMGKDGERDSLGIAFAGSDRKASGVALDKLPTVTNYFIGRNRNEWRTGVNNYGKVRYAAIYPGVDVLFYGNEGKLEHDFVLSPNADPKSIVLEVNGSKSLKLNSDGDVVIKTNHSGEFLLKKPNLYQQSGNRHVAVHGEYQLLSQNRVGFKIASYDKTRSLTIDPVLVFATYVGAQSNGSNANAVAAGTGGDVYVVGTAFSDFSNLTGSPHVTPVVPTGGSSAPTTNGTVFVAKFAAADNGSTIHWLSYIGGTGSDSGNSIAFDSTNAQIVLAGTTNSNDFPISSNAYSNSFGSGIARAFAAAIDAGTGGTTKYYNTYVTISASTPASASFAKGVSFDASGNIYVAGGTQDATLIGTDCSVVVGTNVNSFVAELSSPANGNPGTLVNLAVFSGTSASTSQANALAVTATDVFAVGQVSGDFATDAHMPGNPLASVTIQGQAAYLVDLHLTTQACPATPNSVVHARVYHDNAFGGVGSIDTLTSISLKSDGSSYAAGQTNSGTLSTLDATQSTALVLSGNGNTNHGGEDALIMHLDTMTAPILGPITADGNDVIVVSEFGGSVDELATSISVDANGMVFVGGTTTSLNGSTTAFPSNPGAVADTLDNAIQNVVGKTQSGFVAEFNQNFQTNFFASVIGADTVDSDAINGVAAATGASATLKGDVVALAGTFHGLASTTPNTTASAFLTKVNGGAIANGSAYVGLVEYNGNSSGVSNFAAGTPPANVNYGEAAQYPFVISVATTNDSILNIPAVAGLTNLHIDAVATDPSYAATTNCTSGTGGITCIVPTNAIGSIVVDGTVAVSSGSITVSATLADAANNTSSFTSANLTITPATLTITADAKTKVYGQPDPTLTFVATGFKFTDDASTVLTGALTRAAGETVAGNPYPITQGTLAANTNYTISFTGANLTITSATLTITADARTKIYGDADPALTFVATGFANGDTAGTVLTGALTRAPGETVAGSPYAIAQGTLATNTNYTISFTGANFTITPATLTVTADAKTKIYGDADPALTFVAAGFKFTDNTGTVLTGALARAAGETVAGSPYAITQGTLAANTNYTISFTGANFTITPATLTITADPKTKIYGDADPALTFVATGFKFTDNAGTVLTGALTRAAGETVAGSPYAITQGTLASNTNYTITFTGSNLTITKRSLHLTPNAHSADKIYDRTTAATVSFSDDRVNGDVLIFSSTAVYADPNAGTGKLVNISGIAVSGAAAGNYMLASSTTATTTSDISAKQITVNVTVSDKVYNANTIAAVTGCTPNGIISGDTVNCSAAAANFLTKDVGAGKTVVASGLTLGGNVPDKNNYSITGTTPITANITPAHLTVTANNKSRAYAAADPVFDATLSGFVGGEALGTSGVNGLAACTSTAVTSSAIGSYPITCTQGTLAALNYDFTTFNQGTLNITNVTLTVTPNDKTRVYGAADPTFDGTVVGVQAGDNITATFSTTAVTNSPIGNYQITATLNDPGNRLSNYAVTSNVGTLIITKAPLTITPNDKTRTYGAANPVFDGNVVGVTAGDNISATFSTTATPANGIGNYAITSSVVDSGNRIGNYNVTQNTGTLGITKAHLTVMAVNQTRLYGAVNAGTTFNLVGFQNGENQISANVTGAPTLSNVTSPTTAVGIYAITVVDAGNLSAPNYDFLMSNFANGQLTITPAHLTVTADSQSRVYGGANPALTATISNFVNGETLATSGVTGQALCNTPAIVTSVVAQYPIDCTQNTLTAGNYDFPQFMQGQLNVTAAPLTVTANNKSRTYGAANPTLDGSLVGVTAGDSITAGFSTVATPATAIGTFAITAALNDPGNRLPNYAVTNNSGSLTINPAPLTVTANNAGKIFGQTTNFVGNEFTTSGLLNADQVNSASLASAGATAGSNVGTYSIVLTAPVGIGLTNYNPITLVNGSLTVAAAASSSTVTVPFTPGGNAAKYTFKATVSPQFTGTPTGTVTFMDKGAALAAGDSGQSSTVTLVNGTATFTTTVGQLAAGQLHTITAVYNKDANFAAATSQVAASVFVAAAITTSSGAAIPAQTLQVANPTNQDVTYTNLQCSVLSSLGAVVQSTACTVNPAASLLVPKNGSANASVQIATSNGSSAQPAPSSAALHMQAFGTLALALPAMVFLPMAMPASTRRKLLRRKALTCIGILLLLALAVASMGCGGGGFDNKGLQPGSVITNATPVGNYTVQVTATSSATGQPTALGSIPMTVSF